MNAAVRVLIVGSHAAPAGAIAARLEYAHGFSVVGVVGTVRRAADLLVEQEANVLLIDLDGVEESALCELQALRASHAQLRVMAVSGLIEDAQIERALRIGANGLVARDDVPTTLARAIREVLADGAHFPSSVRDRIIIDSAGVHLQKTGADSHG